MEKCVPLYDYRCPANNRTVEVRHSMHETITSWAELCRLTGMDPGDTPADSPVERLVCIPTMLVKPGTPHSGGCCGMPGCGTNHEGQ